VDAKKRPFPHPSTDARSLGEGGRALSRTGHGAGNRAAAGPDGHGTQHGRSYTGRREGSPEAHRGRGRRSGRAGAGSRPWAVRDAGANGSGTLLPDNHPGVGCTHAGGRADRSHPSAADTGGAGSASGRGRLWECRAACWQRRSREHS
jgi:hypothetical protein